MNAAIPAALRRDDAFDTAIERVLRHEGGFFDHASDPGGATAYGISLRFLRGVGDLDGDGFLDGDLDRDGDVDAHDIRLLDRDRAVALYRSQWWDRYRYCDLPLAVGAKTFDLSVNMGAHQAHVCLQRAVRAAARLRLEEDGILGPQTRNTVRNVDQGLLAVALRAEAAGFYRSLTAKNPKLAVFLAGWLNRAYD